jgi:hypothetical protein
MPQKKKKNPSNEKLKNIACEDAGILQDRRLKT